MKEKERSGDVCVSVLVEFPQGKAMVYAKIREAMFHIASSEREKEYINLRGVECTQVVTKKMWHFLPSVATVGAKFLKKKKATF